MSAFRVPTFLSSLAKRGCLLAAFANHAVAQVPVEPIGDSNVENPGLRSNPVTGESLTLAKPATTNLSGKDSEKPPAPSERSVALAAAFQSPIPSPVPNASIGVEYLWGQRENLDGQRAMAERIQTVFQYNF